MTEADKIQLAGDIIYAQMRNAGNPCTHDQALSCARQIHSVWERSSMLHQLPAGEIAQKFRERYEATADYLKPLLGNAPEDAGAQGRIEYAWDHNHDYRKNGE